MILIAVIAKSHLIIDPEEGGNKTPERRFMNKDIL